MSMHPRDQHNADYDGKKAMKKADVMKLKPGDILTLKWMDAPNSGALLLEKPVRKAGDVSLHCFHFQTRSHDWRALHSQVIAKRGTLEYSEAEQERPMVAQTPPMFMHTKKAVYKAGAPELRVYFEVPHDLLDAEGKREMRGRIWAWKAELTKMGIRHPASSKIISVEDLPNHPDLWGLDPRGPSHSAPTADFKMDSFYKLVTIADLRRLQASL